MEKVFKNKTEKTKVKELVSWIDETYENVDYDKYIKTLDMNDKVLFEAYEMCRLDDDDNKFSAEEIFNVMIPILMEKSFSLTDSSLAKLQQRTNKTFKEVVNSTVKNLPEKTITKKEEPVVEEKVVEEKEPKKIEEKEKVIEDKTDNDEKEFVTDNDDIVSKLNEIDRKVSGEVDTKKATIKEVSNEDDESERAEDLEGYDDYIAFINTDFSKILVNKMS